MHRVVLKNGISSSLKETQYKKPIKILFQDEMRFGLISNYRRSWSLIGERARIPNQQQFCNRYLYSVIDPLQGDSFHLIGWDDVNSRNIHLFIDALKEEYPHHHLVLIWDNAPFHKAKSLQDIEDVTTLSLPPYSPELNPVERYFEELRKVTANRTFESIDAQQEMLENSIVEWMQNRPKMTKLTLYPWIKEQCQIMGFV